MNFCFMKEAGLMHGQLTTLDLGITTDWEIHFISNKDPLKNWHFTISVAEKRIFVAKNFKNLPALKCRLNEMPKYEVNWESFSARCQLPGKDKTVQILAQTVFSDLGSGQVKASDIIWHPPAAGGSYQTLHYFLSSRPVSLKFVSLSIY